MNAPFELRLDKAAFDHWLAGQDRKHEWKEGRVVQMPNVTRAHAKIVANVAHAIAQRIDRERWSVFTSDFGVEDAGWVRFPDVLVEPMDTDDKSRRSAAPVLLAEVLSPSSVGVDFTEKHDEYTSKPSLRAYPIFSQDAPICWVWQRRAAGEPFATQPVEIRGRTATIDIPALGLSLPLAEIYRGITTSEEPA